MNNFALILRKHIPKPYSFHSDFSFFSGLRFWIILSVLSVTAACSASKKVNNGKEIPPVGQNIEEDKKIKTDYYFVEAATQVLLLNYPEAISLYREVLKLDPQNHAAVYEISRILVQTGRPSEALEFAQKAWQMQPNNYWYGMHAVETYLMLNKFTEAEKVLVKMAEEFPEEADVRIELADLYLKTGQNDKALKSLDQLERVSGASAQIFIQRFRIYALSGKNNEARTEMRKLIASDPGNPEYYQFLHDFFQARSLPDSAANVLQELLEIDPSNTFALISLSQYYRSKGKGEEAAVLQARALNSDGIAPEGKLQLLVGLAGRLEQDSTLIRPLSEATDRLLLELPNNPLAMALRADLYRISAKLDSARYWLKASLKIEGAQENLWENLLYLDASLERYDWLFEDSELALEYFPNSEGILYMQGVSAFSLKKYEDARYALEKVIKVMQPDPVKKAQIQGTLGDIYHYLGENTLSDQAFEEALTANGRDATLLNNYAYYLSLRNIELEKAEKMVIKAIEIQPDNSSFEDTYGWILYQQGKYPEALKWIQSAYDRNPSPDIADHLGDVWFRSGNASKAIEYWKKAKELGLNSPELERKISSGTL